MKIMSLQNIYYLSKLLMTRVKVDIYFKTRMKDIVVARPKSPGETGDIIKLRETVFELENVLKLKEEQIQMKEERICFNF